jgi:hypothetical protein
LGVPRTGGRGDVAEAYFVEKTERFPHGKDLLHLWGDVRRTWPDFVLPEIIEDPPIWTWRCPHFLVSVVDTISPTEDGHFVRWVVRVPATGTMFGGDLGDPELKYWLARVEIARP